MQIFKVFGPNGKLCERMDHDGTHIVDASAHASTPSDSVRQSRDSRETRATPRARLAKQPRDSRETSRNRRETAARQPRICAGDWPRLDLRSSLPRWRGRWQ